LPAFPRSFSINALTIKELKKAKKNQKFFIRIDENLLASYLKFMILLGVFPD